MNFENFASEEMKQNLDSNIIYGIRDQKQSSQKQPKTTKRQLFRQVNGESQSKQIKKNAYIFDSDQENSPDKEFRKQCKSHRSIDDVSQIIGSLSKQGSIPTSPKTQLSTPLMTCEHHNRGIYSYNFCIQCSQYLMCPSCVNQNHESHMILTFGNEQQTKALTKQFLIQKIEETLQKLKSKENDIKNKSTQMDLIVSNVKRMEEQVMNKLETVFREIGDLVRTVYEKENFLYERKIDEFYQKYNGVGDELRENLLTIIDESFEIKSFNVSSICKQPPMIPNEEINKFKSVLEKTKSFYKSVMESIEELKQKTHEKSRVISCSKGSKVMGRKEVSTKKYEKFLSDACYQNDNGGDISKSSLVKILDTLSK